MSEFDTFAPDTATGEDRCTCGKRCAAGRYECEQCVREGSPAPRHMTQHDQRRLAIHTAELAARQQQRLGNQALAAHHHQRAVRMRGIA